MTYNPDSIQKPLPDPPSNYTGGKMIYWVDGKPVPVYAKPLNKQQVADLVTAALSTEYESFRDPESGEEYNVDPRLVGTTKAEAMAINLARKASRGEDKATNQVLDRILGKPKQSVESVGVKMNYRDFLEMLDRDEKAQSQAEFEVSNHTIDAELDTADAYATFDDSLDEDDDDWL